MRSTAKIIEGECRALIVRLGAEGQWAGFRCWMAAQAIVPQPGVPPRDIIALWVEETISEDAGISDMAQLIETAANGWLPALRHAMAAEFRLVATPADRTSEVQLRLGEVAGFLDGLLNRASDPPDNAILREEIARLEAIEELLDGIGGEDGPGSRAASLIIDNLTRGIEDGIARLAQRYRAMREMHG